MKSVNRNLFHIRALCLAFVLLIAFVLSACSANPAQPSDSTPVLETDEPLVVSTATPEAENEAEEEEEVPTITVTIIKDKRFGHADFDADEDDFTNAGFRFGDSLDVAFSNGAVYTDVPYYSGYYVKTGELAVVAYPTNDFVLMAKNNADFWTDEGMLEGMTAVITLNTAEKYHATSDALSQSYSSERDEFETDEEFANFRALSGGNLKENLLYRGASPVDNVHGRAVCADTLLNINNIACVIDLADTEEDLETYFNAPEFASVYTKFLYDEGNVIALGMTSSYGSDAYKQSVAEGLRFLMAHGGPAYIHCTEGKDRTGFVCLLIEALAGASYLELRDDYMQTYDNYYGFAEGKTPEKYDAVVALYFDTFLEYLYGSDDASVLIAADYTDCAKDYLLSAGMSETEISDLITFLTK